MKALTETQIQYLHFLNGTRADRPRCAHATIEKGLKRRGLMEYVPIPGTAAWTFAITEAGKLALAEATA